MLTLERTAPPTEREARAETEVLLQCGRRLAGDRRLNGSQSLPGRGINWAHLLWAAHRQGMLPALEAAGLDHVPDAILGQLHEHSHANRRRNRVLLDELRAIVLLLDRHGIRALPLRVPSILTRLYPDPGARQCEPLDLLVAPDDAERGRRLLIERGYVPVHQLSPVQEAAQRRARASMLQHPELSIRIHLHDRVAPTYFPVRLDLDLLWQRRESLAFDNTVVPCPSAEDLLVLLCLHGALHLWGQLVWVCDVARLVQDSPGLRWQMVLGQARAAGVRRILLLGLDLAHSLLGTALPEPVREQIAADPSVCALAEQVRTRLTHDLRGRMGEGERLRYRLRTRERLADRLRYCTAFALSPTVEDWKALPLPDALFPLYYAVRPARLAGTLGSRILPIRQRAPYMSSPMPVVERMLAMAGIGPDDVVYDLGCGDGRIVIAAALRYGARGVGIDLDPERIAESRANARAAGVEHLVRFIQGDAIKVDLTPATVVTLWMLQTLNLHLRPRLQAELRPGTRIVGHSFDMGDWAPERTDIVTHDDEVALAYLWRVDGTSAGSPPQFDATVPR